MDNFLQAVLKFKITNFGRIKIQHLANQRGTILRYHDNQASEEFDGSSDSDDEKGISKKKRKRQKRKK